MSNTKLDLYAREEIGRKLIKFIVSTSKKLIKDNKNYYRCRDDEKHIWDWDGIAKNPNITWNIIKENINNKHCFWYWNSVCQNPNITYHIFVKEKINEKCTDFFWCFPINPSLKWEDIQEIIKNNLDNRLINWDEISKHQNVTWENIKENLDFNWRWNYVLQNPNITLDIINEVHEIGDWSYIYFWWCLSFNPNLTWEFVQEHIKESWNWKYLSKHKNIKWKDIKENLDNKDCEWDIDEIYKNPNLEWKDIEYIMDTYDYETRRTCIWREISENSNITFDIIEKEYHRFDWDSGMSLNPNITLDIIEKNPNKRWNLRDLSKNPFTKEFNDLKEKYTKSIEKIEEWWLEVTYNPTYKKCRELRWKEFEEILQE